MNTDNKALEKWQDVWRRGFGPTLPLAGLENLRDALMANDERLIQSATTLPQALHCVRDWQCEGACAVSFAGWLAGELDTVGEVEEFFARACFECDQLLGEPAACRFFLNWFDDTPRPIVLKELLVEVEQTLRWRRDEANG